MKLAIKNSKIPLKAYTEEKLNRAILMNFMPWLCRILSLTDETSADRLEMALPAIKEHCWSMGFDEIKKMFEMYADGKLSIKPLPNYFDRILLGKIVHAYKTQRPKKTIKIENTMSNEDEKKIVKAAILDEFENFKWNKVVSPFRAYLYDEMVKIGLGCDDATKKAAWKIAQQDVKKEKGLNFQDQKARAITHCKVLLLEHIFNKYTDVKQIEKLI